MTSSEPVQDTRFLTYFLQKIVMHKLGIYERTKLQSILGTTDVTWKPILTAIPDVWFAAYRANVAYIYKIDNK